MWVHHPSGKIAVYIKDPVDISNANEVSQDKQKKRFKKK